VSIVVDGDFAAGDCVRVRARGCVGDDIGEGSLEGCSKETNFMPFSNLTRFIKENEHLHEERYDQ
jgi:hypothetical protein